MKDDDVYAWPVAELWRLDDIVHEIVVPRRA